MTTKPEPTGERDWADAAAADALVDICTSYPEDRAEAEKVVAAALRDVAARERAKTNHYHESLSQQADGTLALILKGYGVEHVHDQCGVICKINAVEGLLETQRAEGFNAGIEAAAMRVLLREGSQFTQGALGRLHISEAIRALKEQENG